MALFKNRIDAGRQLAERLVQYGDQPDVLVLGLPRGGVPVAYEVARVLNAPMDIFLVRKLGVPGHEELAFGAIASGGIEVINHGVVQSLGIPERVLQEIARKEWDELKRREIAFRGDRPEPDVSGKTVILIDDGLATGASMYAAVLALRKPGPKDIIAAVPVGSPETCQAFEREVGKIVCAHTPQPFLGVGQWYQDFNQIDDDEVRELLLQAQEHTNF